MNALSDEINRSESISNETEDLLQRISDREKNIEKLRNELYQF